MSVDTSKFTYTITKNGQQVGGEYTANVTASSNNDNNNINIILQQRCLSLMPVKAAR